MSSTPHAILFALLVGCSPQPPRFSGETNDGWLAYDVKLEAEREPEPLVLGFEASAREHGCRTERMYRGGGGGATRLYYAITAYCPEGTVAFMPRSTRRVTLGCATPLTRSKCEELVKAIVDARP